MHSHHYSYEQASKSQNKNLIKAIILNSIIVAGEIIGGILSNSLSLISDALHNLGDLFALLLSLFANFIAMKKANPQKSFGYIRSEILVAFLNSSILLLIGSYIIYEGIIRIQNPEKVVGNIVLIVAGISFFANSLSSFFLKDDSKKSLNIKSSYLHLIYDAVHSLAVLIVGVVLVFYDFYIMDSISSIIIGLFIFKSAWNVVKETTNILSEGTPKEIDHNEVEKFLLSVSEVQNVHHLHIWKLSTGFIAMSVHIVVTDQLLSKSYLIIDKIEKLLYEKFGINHPTIQLEAMIEKNNTELKNFYS